jgi:hypothetical protein
VEIIHQVQFLQNERDGLLVVNTALRAENERLRTAMIWYIVNCDEEPSEEALQAIAPLAQGTYWITIERTEAARAFLARNAEKEER